MPFGRVIWIVLDSVGIGEMPDAAEYGDAGSDTLGNIARKRPMRSAEPGRARAWATSSRFAGIPPAAQPARRLSATARWHRRARTRPPGIGRWPASTWTSPSRCSRTDSRAKFMDEFERRIGRGSLGNMRGVRHRDHQGTGRGAHAHRFADRLHLGRQRLPGGGARRSHPAVGTVQDLRDRARNPARPVRGGARDRASVRRRARRVRPHLQPPRLRRAAAQGHAARPPRRTRRRGVQRRQDLRCLPGARHPAIREDQEQRRRHGRRPSRRCRRSKAA